MGGQESSVESVRADWGWQLSTETHGVQDFIDPKEFAIRLKSSDCTFAHAGMGSILLALENAKPIIVMPRDPDLGEHQNRHQIATAERFKQIEQIQVAMNEQELPVLLDAYAEGTDRQPIGKDGSASLIRVIRNSIRQYDD